MNHFPLNINKTLRRHQAGIIFTVRIRNKAYLGCEMHLSVLTFLNVKLSNIQIMKRSMGIFRSNYIKEGYVFILLVSFLRPGIIQFFLLVICGIVNHTNVNGMYIFHSRSMVFHLLTAK